MQKGRFPVLLCFLMLACDHGGGGGTAIDSMETDPVRTDQLNRDSTAGATGSLNDAERAFVLRVYEHNAVEAAAGQLAREKGKNFAVRDFGALMVKHHAEFQLRLKRNIRDLGVAFTDSGGTSAKAMQDYLAALGEDAFDLEYIRVQVTAHRDVIALFEHQSRTGTHPQLRELASSALPQLRIHLEKAEAIAAKLGR